MTSPECPSSVPASKGCCDAASSLPFISTKGVKAMLGSPDAHEAMCSPSIE